MTKQRIKLSSREIRQDKARAVLRARNGTVNKCLAIFKDKVAPFTSYILTHGRIILPESIVDEIKEEMKALRR